MNPLSFLIAAIVAGALGAAANRAGGEVIIWEFSGEVTYLSDPTNFLGGGVALGTPFHGTFSIESTTPDSDPANPKRGLYEDAITALSGQVGDVVFTFSNDPLVAEAVSGITAAERKGVVFTDAPKEAATGDFDSPIIASLALADRQGATAPNGELRPIFVRIDGALYTLDAKSGTLLWRRFVGFDLAGSPLALKEDVLVTEDGAEYLHPPQTELILA